MRKPYRQAGPMAAIVLAAMLPTGPALAAGFAIATQNASSLGNAIAGAAAVAEDASTIFYNPAGMTRLGRGEAVLSAVPLLTSNKFSHSGTVAAASPSPLNPNTGGNGGDAGGFAVVPALYGSWEVLPGQLWVGLGINSPFGLKTEWDSDWVGRFHAIKSEVQAIHINPSVAYKVNNFLSLGAGVSAMRLEAELTNAVPYSTIAGGLLPGGLEGVAKVKGDDWGWGWNIGALLQVTPMTRVGLTYRSTIKHTLEGDVTFGNRPAPLAAALPDGPVRADVKLPDMAAVAVAHQLGPRWLLLADFTWTGWSSIHDLNVVRTNGTTLTSTPLRFKDSWRIGIGATHLISAAWSVKLGLAYDQTPVEDAFRTPRLPDQSRTWLAFGAQWRPTKTGVVDFGYAYEFVRDASSSLPSQDTPTSIPRGALNGNYKAGVHIVGIQYRHLF